MRRRTTFLIVAGVFAVLAAVTLVKPLLEKEQRVTSTSTPAPLYSVSGIHVQPGDSVCAKLTLFTPETELAEVLWDRKERRPPLTVTASADGYRATARVPAGRGGRHSVLVPIDPPDRDVIGDFCIRNDGTDEATFVGVEEFRTLTRSQTFVAGERLEPDLTLQFYGAKPQSALALVPEMADRMSVGRGFLGLTPLVWLLILGAFLGVPALVGWVFWTMLGRDPER